MPIAVIGMGCRFPGGANTPERYWRLLREGRTGITRVPADRWDADAYFHSDRDRPGTLCSREGGFLDQIDLFDADFFQISPREAASMDPQQRLALEVAWEALEDAACAGEELAGSDTGVFLGVTTNDFERLELRSDDPADIRRYSLTGTTRSLAAGRISYFLGLTGPSLVVDTACSSSLVAISLACQSLRHGECRMALAGGVNILLDPAIGIAITKMHLLSRDGGSHSFEAEADGFGRGEGCGILVLKRWADAVADGDRVIALVAGTAVNQNGRSAGVFAPHGPAQTAVIRRALDDAGLPPEAVGYVEAQGIGTALGHVVEVRALTEVLSLGRAAEDPLYVGSVKGNIGHLESASGVAGVMKLALAIQAGELPPNVHQGTWNPAIDQTGWHVQFPTEVMPWRASHGRRVAGINAFSFSGTNAHLVLQDAPTLPRKPSAAEPRERLYVLSARSPLELRMLALRHAEALESIDDAAFADACYTAAVGRRHFAHRLAMPVESWSKLQFELRAFVSDRPVQRLRTSHVDPYSSPAVAWWFTGQEDFVPAGQVATLLASQPAFQAAWQRCLDALPNEACVGVERLLSSAEKESVGRIAGTARTCFSFVSQYALASMLRDWGIQPAAVLGHGIGHAVAGCLADQLPLVAVLQGLAAGGGWEQWPVDSPPDVSGSILWLDAVTGEAVETNQGAIQPRAPIDEDIPPAARQALDTLEIPWIVDCGACGRLADAACRSSSTLVPTVSRAWEVEGPMGPSLIRLVQEAYLRGFALDFQRVEAGGDRRRVALPTYPFRRKRYWPTDGLSAERGSPRDALPRQEGKRLGRRLQTAGSEIIFETRLRPTDWESTATTAGDPTGINLAMLGLCLASEAGETLNENAIELCDNENAIELCDVEFPELESGLDRARQIQTVIGPETASRRSFHVASSAVGAERRWLIHAAGHLSQRERRPGDSRMATAQGWHAADLIGRVHGEDVFEKLMASVTLLQLRIWPTQSEATAIMLRPIRLHSAWWEPQLPGELACSVRCSEDSLRTNDAPRGTIRAELCWHEGERILGEIRGLEIAWLRTIRPESKGTGRDAPIGRLSSVEELLAYLSRCVRDILGTEPGQPLDVQRSFRDLGMDSLMAVELAGVVERLLGKPVPPDLFFTYSTLAALAEYVAEGRRTEALPGA